MDNIADYYLWVRVTNKAGSAAPVPPGHEVPDEVKKKYDGDLNTKDPGKKPPPVVPDRLAADPRQADGAKPPYVAMQLLPAHNLPGGGDMEFSLGAMFRSNAEAMKWIFSEGRAWADEGQVHLLATYDLRLP